MMPTTRTVQPLLRPDKFDELMDGIVRLPKGVAPPVIVALESRAHFCRFTLGDALHGGCPPTCALRPDPVPSSRGFC